MKKKFVLYLVLLLSVGQMSWAMEEEGNGKNAQRSSDTKINIEFSEMEHQVQVKTLYNTIGESLTTVGLKVIRKAQKSTGLVNVASENKKEYERCLYNFGSITNLSELSEDAKQGGVFNGTPSYFKKVNDRIYYNNIATQTILVSMHDTKSLDISQLSEAKKHMDASGAYSTAMQMLLSNCYNEKLNEIKLNIPKNEATKEKEEIEEEKK